MIPGASLAALERHEKAARREAEAWQAESPWLARLRRQDAATLRCLRWQQEQIENPHPEKS